MLGKWCGHEVAALRSWSYENGWDCPERAWRAGLFSTGTAGIWGRTFFAVGAYPVHWKVFSTNPGLYSLGASRAPSIVARQMSLDIAKRPWIRVGSKKKRLFFENHWFRVMRGPGRKEYQRVWSDQRGNFTPKRRCKGMAKEPGGKWVDIGVIELRKGK